MSHGNARLTVHGRLLIVQRHQDGWPQAHIAAAMGVSRKCVKTWIDRYAAEGEAGLRDRSSRPHSMPTRTRPRSSTKVVEVRRRERRGPDWIGAELGVPRRTVSRILARHGVPLLASLDPITGEVIRGQQGHRGPLRARPAGRAGPHGRQEARPDPRRRRLAGPRPRPGHDRRTATPSRLRLRALPGRRPLPAGLLRGPARREGPDLRGVPATAPIDYFAAHGITRIERADDRQRLGLPVVPARALRRRPASTRCSSSPTAHGRTARSSASTAPCSPSGPTARSSPATTSAPPPLRPGSSTTTLNDATAHSEDSHPSAVCYQPDGPVHLAATRGRPPGRYRETGSRRPATTGVAFGPGAGWARTGVRR